MIIKSYRGLLKDGAQDKIPLHTGDGKTGYRIINFQIFFKIPGDDSHDSVVQVWKIDQTKGGATVPINYATVDFTDLNLLACAQLVQAASVLYQTTTGPVIFEREVFNQDIYVTHTDSESQNYFVNYYLELEQIKLTEIEALAAIIKDLREEQ